MMDLEKELLNGPVKEKEEKEYKSTLVKPKGERYTWDEFIALVNQELPEAVKLIIDAAIDSDTIMFFFLLELRSI